VTCPPFLWITLLASGRDVTFHPGKTLVCCEMRQFDDGPGTVRAKRQP
jgi:hypothetical protein